MLNFRKELSKIRKQQLSNKLEKDEFEDDEFVNNILKDVLEYLKSQDLMENKKIILGFGFDEKNIYFRTVIKDGILEYVSQPIKQYSCSERNVCIVLQHLAYIFQKEMFFVKFSTNYYFEVEICL